MISMDVDQKLKDLNIVINNHSITQIKILLVQAQENYMRVLLNLIIV